MRKSKWLLFSLLLIVTLLVGCSKPDKTPNGNDKAEAYVGDTQSDFKLVIPEEMEDKNFISVTEFDESDSKSTYCVIYNNDYCASDLQFIIPNLKSDLLCSREEDTVTFRSRGDSHYITAIWAEPLMSETHMDIASFSDEDILNTVDVNATIVLREETENGYLVIAESENSEDGVITQTAILRDTKNEVVCYFITTETVETYNQEDLISAIKGIAVYRHKNEGSTGNYIDVATSDNIVESDSE